MTNSAAQSLKHLGEDSVLHPDVDIVSAEKIWIGSGVTIERGVLIDATYGQEIVIGNGVTIKRYSSLIASGSEFENGYIRIGERTHIGMYNLLAGHAGLKIGADVLCGPYVSVNGYAHNFSNDDIPINGQGGVAKQIEILHNSYVATRSTILTGPIGPGAVIGAHSLVTDPVEPNSIVHGVPAKHVRFRN